MQEFHLGFFVQQLGGDLHLDAVGGVDAAALHPADAGGGDRDGLLGLRRLEDVEEAFESATREAEVAFGNGDCFLERFLDRPRHVEVQILADTHGDVKAIDTRDCSLQRRNQKLIEEAPAPFLSDAITEHLKRTAVAICRKAGYVSAGTVEFLVADDGTMSFMEVNTRIQVEHPVTEMTTGIDLVAEQLRIADGGSIADLEPQLHGHAIEFRINAEDPAHGFVPFPGHIDDLHVPSGPGIRFDTGIAVGTDIPDQFDSMLAKLVVYAPDRDACLRRARRALAELRIVGVPTVIPFDKAFSALAPDTFIRDYLVGRIGAETLVVGFNHRFGRDKQGSYDYLGSHGFGLEVVEVGECDVDAEKVSSTVIRRLVAQGDMARAARLLSHPYLVIGTAAAGRIRTDDPLKLLPPAGSYQVRIGGRPARLTVDASQNLIIRDGCPDGRAVLTF